MMLRKSKKIASYLSDFLFPIACLGCGQPGYYFCPDCARKIDGCLNNSCPFCGVSSKNGRVCSQCKRNHCLDGLLSFAYLVDGSLIKKIVNNLKYQSVFLTARDLGWAMTKNEKIGRLLGNWRNNLLVAVPRNKKEERRRGYNQAQFLAEAVGMASGNAIKNSLLIKIGKLPKESSFEDGEEKMFERVFQIKEQRILRSVLRRRIILIDDVMTTGATLESCAQTLKKAGFQEVVGLVAARQIRTG